jgi:hypothetical protein
MENKKQKIEKTIILLSTVYDFEIVDELIDTNLLVVKFSIFKVHDLNSNRKSLDHKNTTHNK